MEQQILKKDIIFTGNGLRIYMFIKHEYDDFDKIVPIVKSVYPVLNHTIKGDCLFVVTQDAFIEWDTLPANVEWYLLMFPLRN